MELNWTELLVPVHFRSVHFYLRDVNWLSCTLVSIGQLYRRGLCVDEVIKFSLVLQLLMDCKWTTPAAAAKTLANRWSRVVDNNFVRPAGNDDQYSQSDN